MTEWKDPESEPAPDDVLLLGWWWKTESPHVVYWLRDQTKAKGKGWFFFDNGGLSPDSPPDLWAMIDEPQRTDNSQSANRSINQSQTHPADTTPTRPGPTKSSPEI